MEREFESVLGCSASNNRPIGPMDFPASLSVLQRLRELTSKDGVCGDLRYTGNGTEAGSAVNMPRRQWKESKREKRPGTAAKTLRGSAKLEMAK